MHTYNTCFSSHALLYTNFFSLFLLAYAYTLCLFLGELSEQNTAYGMSHDLKTSVIPENCAILKSVVISFAYHSFQTSSNSKLITMLSKKRMVHSITNYSWHLNRIMVENFSHVFMHTCFRRLTFDKQHNQWFSHNAIILYGYV